MPAIMPWDRTLFSLQYGRFLLRCLWYCDSPRPLAINDWWRDNPFPPADWFLIPGTVSRPNLLIGLTPDRIIVAMQGTQTAAQGIALIAGYDPVSQRVPLVNDYAQALAGSWAADVIRNAGNRRKISLVGHSLGGAAAQVFQREMEAQGFKVDCWTFGSPNCWGQSSIDSVRRMRHVRCFRQDDPVPFVCPPPSMAPLWYAGLSTQARAKAAQFRHACVGLQIGDNLTFSEAWYPQAALISPQASLASWLVQTALNRAPTSNHSVPAYLAGLGDWMGVYFYDRDEEPFGSGGGDLPENDPVNPNVNAAPLPQVIPPPAPMGGPQAPFASPEIIRQLTQAVQPATPFPRGLLMTTVKFENEWAVVWQGQILCIADKVKARAVRRQGNQFIRALYTNTDMDPNALAMTMQAFAQSSQQV